MAGILGAYCGSFGRTTLLDIQRPIASHAHPHMHLLFKLSGADRGMLVDDEVHMLSENSCILVNSWQRHADVEALCIAPTLVLALYVDPVWYAARTNHSADSVFSRLSCDIGPVTRQSAARIAGWLVRPRRPADSTLERAILTIIEDTVARAHLVPRQLSSDFRIRRAARALRDDIHLRPDLSTLARQVGLSRSRFFDQFKNAVGVAPFMYLDGLLLERAIDLLVGSQAPLDTISRQLGFSAHSSFTRFFRERVGFPPSTLRAASSPQH